MNRKNGIYIAYRLLKCKILKERSPAGAAIKITQQCNLRCNHCPWQNQITETLPFMEWKTIIDELYSQGVIVIVVEGGEPTLYKDAANVVEYIKSKGMYCIYSTNGTLDIANIHPDVFWISIDGMRETHDRVRGAGVFEKVIGTLRKNPDKKFISLTTISKTNRQDIEPLCEYFSSSELLNGLMFHFQYPYAAIKDAALDREERRAVARQLIELKKKYPKVMNSVSYLKTVGKDKPCYPWLLVVVTADGKREHGCMVKHIEEEDCTKCDMGCYGESSRAYELKSDSLEFWSKNYGFPLPWI
jgi:MoaA/NifB/PqqE/SkfB family radical SAM enzyme